MHDLRPGRPRPDALYTNTDLNFSQTFRLPKGTRLHAAVRDHEPVRSGLHDAMFTSPWRDALVLPNDGGTLNAGPFFAGFDTAAAQAARFAASDGTPGGRIRGTAWMSRSAARGRRGST